MITTKRQIRRDSDRFGGFYTAEEDISRISDYDNITNLEPIAEPTASVGNSMLRTDGPAAEPISEQPIYTAPQQMHAPVEAPAPAERPAKQTPPRSKEDLLPTVKTRAYATEQPVQDIEEQTERKTAPAKRAHAALDSKTKLMLCIYVVVALVLAIAVIATGVSISKASAQADEIAISVAQKQAVILEQEKELALLQDADTIRGKAVVNGMVPAGEPAYSITSVETVGYPEATPRTDGFDEMMDWLDKVFH